ncbi:hypothetical protein B0A50_05389 [Salinomyces thailandicus]|uniref:Uncharacterized protein n=1 Tax=Salinomyces thailandicus TaxID=706561 RepID=A0A4U0TTK2_9PEZI|nr:hypothetical protein B0A50_05389 [Salinomyces thailandica]
MPTQRPFLSNFLAAFRAHSQQLPKAAPSLSTSGTQSSTASIWTLAQPPPTRSQSPTASENAVTSPRPINPKAAGNQYSNTQSTSTTAQDRQLYASLSPLQHQVSPQTHLPRSSPSPGLPVYGPPNKPQPSYPTCQETSISGSRARRRGSDSSSDSGGFREVNRGTRADAWLVGGRTANGEERYYKLSMVKRDRSADRLSADRLSL